MKKKIENVLDECYKIYENFGYDRVIRHVEIEQANNNPAYVDVKDEWCAACDNHMPSLNHICLICGQTTVEPLYFKVVSTGYNTELQREEVEINCGENGKLMLIKTEQGFIIDVYGQNDNIFTETVWEDDLIGDDVEEESGAPQNFSDVEVEEWKENWGQSHGEITSELGFPRSHAEADELILNTGNYFWDEKDKKWYNRYASLFTDRERAIADYLYYLNQNE